MDHLIAIQERLGREKARLERCRTSYPNEVAIRTVWVAQAEKELANEIAFLKARGLYDDVSPEIQAMSAYQLLEALGV